MVYGIIVLPNGRRFIHKFPKKNERDLERSASMNFEYPRAIAITADSDFGGDWGFKSDPKKKHKVELRKTAALGTSQALYYRLEVVHASECSPYIQLQQFLLDFGCRWIA